MTRHLFLTGPKGVGKSTLIRDFLDRETGRLGGFFTVKHRGSVYLLRAGAGEAPDAENFLFRCGCGGDPGRFDALGCAALADTEGCSLLVMEERGPQGAQAVRVQAAVFRALEGGIPILGVLQQADSDFLRRIACHPRVTVLTVTEDNRDSLGAALRRWREER